LLKVKERTPVGVLFYFGNLSDIAVVGEGVKAVAKSGFKCSSVQVFKVTIGTLGIFEKAASVSAFSEECLSFLEGEPLVCRRGPGPCCARVPLSLELSRRPGDSRDRSSTGRAIRGALVKRGAC